MLKSFNDNEINDISKDTLDVKEYVESLAEFILDCESPLTVAIQGDWGSGKTSIMKMIKNYINIKDNQNIRCIWVNTWQYSHLNINNNATVILGNKILDALDTNNEKKQIVKKSLYLISRAVLSNIPYIGGSIKEVVDEASNFINTSINELESLKNKFQDAVNSDSCKKIIIFIDDIDRLNPKQAVELLEIIKLFLDVTKCVFVLAVDYEIVLRGIKDKYGESIDDVKGRSFFDKIIQLPFRVPLEQYNTRKYISQKIGSVIGSEKVSHQSIVKYTNLLECTVGSNPRSIKRIMNSFVLLNHVRNKKSKNTLNSEFEFIVIFAFICLQTSYEYIYKYFVNKINSIEDIEDRDFEIQNILDKFIDREAFIQETQGKFKIDFSSDMSFINNMCIFFTLLNEEIKNEKHNDTYNRFVELINLSSVTSSSEIFKDKKTSIKSPEYILLDNKRFDTKSWRDVLKSTFNYALKKDENKFKTVLTPKKNWVAWTDSDISEMNSKYDNNTCNLDNDKYILCTKLGSMEIEKRVRTICRDMGIELKFE